MTDTALDQRRVLVVEDEYFIAADVSRALRLHGAEIVGPVGDVGRGLSLAGGGRLDAAVLDVNVEGGSSLAIADRLAGADVPFMFLTGYDRASLPEAYRDAPHLAKPFTIAALVATLTRLCRRETAA